MGNKLSIGRCLIYNFTERWKKRFKAKRIKPFHRELTTKQNYLFYETQAIRKRRTKLRKNRKVQANKSIR